MNRLKMAIIPILFILLLAGCAQTQKTSIDQAIQYRSIFNSTLLSFETNLKTLPVVSQQKYAAMALPFATAGMTTLNTMDMLASNGSAIDATTLQQYLAAKNALIDLIAKIMIEKGGK